MSVMLPDIPDTKARILRLLRLRMHATTRSLNPLFTLSVNTVQHEGQSHTFERTGVGVVTEKFAVASAPGQVKLEEVPLLVDDALYAKVDAWAAEIARQMSQEGFRKIGEALEKVGSDFHAGGRPLTQEMYLEILGGLEVGFDEHGDPTLTIVGHPDMLNPMMEAMGQWQNDPVFRARYEELLARKREDWRDRESNRKLVD